MEKSHGRAIIGVCIAVLIGLTAPGFLPAADDQIEEVVITSEKRAAGISVQDVPIAVTAVNEALLARTFAVDLADVGRLAPGAMLAPSSTFASSIRRSIAGTAARPASRRAFGVGSRATSIHAWRASAWTSILPSKSSENFCCWSCPRPT